MAHLAHMQFLLSHLSMNQLKVKTIKCHCVQADHMRTSDVFRLDRGKCDILHHVQHCNGSLINNAVVITTVCVALRGDCRLICHFTCVTRVLAAQKETELTTVCAASVSRWTLKLGYLTNDLLG